MVTGNGIAPRAHAGAPGTDNVPRGRERRTLHGYFSNGQTGAFCHDMTPRAYMYSAVLIQSLRL